MDTWVKLNSSTAGKDKLIRVLQYALKVVNHYHQGSSNSDAVLKWKQLEGALSSFRKCELVHWRQHLIIYVVLRMGKSLEVLRGTSRTLRLSDPVYRLTLTIGRIAQALFLFADHLLWLSRAGLIRIDSRKWEQIFYRCWLYSITMNLCRDAYDLWRVAELCAEHGLPSAPRRRLLPDLRGRPLAILLSRHRDLAVDTLKNVCDLALPLSALGHLPLSPGGVGVCGVVSSALALWAVMDPSLVLRPS